MAEYQVGWSKTYISAGACVIEATSIEEAEDKMANMLGDQIGSMQYDPDEDWVQAREI